jgi:hypothetical protein
LHDPKARGRLNYHVFFLLDCVALTQHFDILSLFEGAGYDSPEGEETAIGLIVYKFDYVDAQRALRVAFG